ncbi:hypothetical protein Ancab_001131 [Ancistrocladus abbreviatus]
MMQKGILFKENGGFFQNPSSGQIPWWIPNNGVGSQASPAILHNCHDQHPNSSKQDGDKRNFLKGKDAQDHQANIFQQASVTQQKDYFELGLGQPMGPFMLPLSLTSEDELMYVNPKQYHGIIRRRKIRAKLALKFKPVRDKPYLHESRHRHAMRRPRGAGGRFLNTKDLPLVNNGKEGTITCKVVKKASDHPHTIFHTSQSSSSEVVQSDILNLNTSSEVTSMFYTKDIDCFQVDHGHPPAFHGFANVEGRQGGSWGCTS